MEDLERKKKVHRSHPDHKWKPTFKPTCWHLSNDSNMIQMASTSFNFSFLMVFLMVFLIFSQALMTFRTRGIGDFSMRPKILRDASHRRQISPDQPGDPEIIGDHRRSVKQLYLSVKTPEQIVDFMDLHGIPICILYMYSIWHPILAKSLSSISSFEEILIF
jgi:hypothetical protein